MRSIADNLRRESAEAVGRLTASERIALALRLGDQDVALHMTAHCCSADDSRVALKRGRAVGRVPSPSNAIDPP